MVLSLNPAGILERGALSYLENAQLRGRGDARAPLHRRALEAEEVEHRIAHAGNSGEHTAGKQQ